MISSFLGIRTVQNPKCIVECAVDCKHFRLYKFDNILNLICRVKDLAHTATLFIVSILFCVYLVISYVCVFLVNSPNKL
jgi:hypothetical protein